MSNLKIPEELNREGVPRHIAIIMDGNGRWAKRRSLPRIAGHREGIRSVREIVETCGEIGVEVLTLYTFSSENWKRPKKEVSALMGLLLVSINHEVKDLDKNNVRLKVIGRIDDLPEKPRKAMLQAIDKLKDNTGLTLVLALSYGSRQEIIDAVNKIISDGVDEVSVDQFSNYLYTSDLPDPELLIRTSGELRLSNFLLWQLAYTEIYIAPVFWPDFRTPQLFDAIKAYQTRERRFGLVSEQLETK